MTVEKREFAHATGQKLWWSAAILLLIWMLAFWDGLVSAWQIWTGNEIFNHGAFIVPGALYLIYRQRRKLAMRPPRPAWICLPPLIVLALLYVFGHAGDIQLVMHVAMFSFLPLTIAFLIGIRGALAIFYPLVFFLFAIPVGEQLVPTLQDISAKGAVYLLKASGIPVFREGLYIVIPQGQFLVAEACSGISFTIVSVVFGTLYAHLNFQSLTKKLAFLLISMVVPILANIVRVYGIIGIAYLSDMEYAVGADHLIYGWVFFAFVMFLLVLIGEPLRDKMPEDESAQQSLSLHPDWSLTTFRTPGVIVLLVLAAQWGLSHLWLDKPASYASASVELSDLQPQTRHDWSPHYVGATQTISGQILVDDQRYDLFVAWYDNNSEGELISYQNRDYDNEQWNFIHHKTVTKGDSTYRLTLITSPGGKKRLVLSCFQLPAMTTASSARAKLVQTMQFLVSKVQEGAYVAWSIPVPDDATPETIRALENSLIQVAAARNETLRAALPFRVHSQ